MATTTTTTTQQTVTSTLTIQPKSVAPAAAAAPAKSLDEPVYDTPSTSTNFWTWTQTNSFTIFGLSLAQVIFHTVFVGYLSEYNTLTRHLIGHIVQILTCEFFCWGVDKIVYDSSKGRFKPTFSEWVKVYKVVLPHLLIDTAVEYFFLEQFYHPMDNPSIFNTGWKCILWLPALAILVDLFFYSTHRLIHENKFLYRTVHKKHHEYQESFAPVFYYTTLAEHLMTFTVYQILAVFVVRDYIFPHYSIYEHTLIIQFFQWVGFYGHTGTVVLSLDFANQINSRLNLHSSTRMHDMHHKYFLCNYGAFCAAWDHLFGTYKRWEEVKKNV